MLDLIIDNFKDEFIGKTIKSLEINSCDFTIYFTDGDLIRVETKEENTEIMVFTFR